MSCQRLPCLVYISRFQLDKNNLKPEIKVSLLHMATRGEARAPALLQALLS